MPAVADVPDTLLARLDALRAELADLAFDLERRGRLDAADVANATSARLGEFRAEVAAFDRLPDPRGAA